MKYARKIATLLAAVSLSAAANTYAMGYVEPTDGPPPSQEDWAGVDGTHFTWASKDVHYPKHANPRLAIVEDTVVKAWRGERIGVQALLYSASGTPGLELRAKGKGVDAQARFVNYVLTNSYNTCGAPPDTLKPYLVPDVIDLESQKALAPMSVRPVWVSVCVPADAKAGKHKVSVEVSEAVRGKKVGALNLVVDVVGRTLPEPKDWAFNLNMWIQPYSVSRYHSVPKWSVEHFRLLRPYMEMLAAAGQKTATAILFYEPWGDQSHDKFDPMVETTLKADGSWEYDYGVFDKWVEFLASCGIDGQINCFSMIPWDMSFRYWDEAERRYRHLKTTTGSPEYKALWTPFLKSFAAHLKEKGWFEKTAIAMDERPLEDMLNAWKVAQEAVPGIKMALAGNHHGELADKLYDYCIAFEQSFTPEELALRKDKGFISTTYNCCAQAAPNIFSNSSPDEAVYLPVACAARGFDGYLRWAWMNWPDHPLQDTRFRLFAAGDTYSIYPGPRSSVRHERLVEGIQAYEKIRILRGEYRSSGDSAALETLEKAVLPFAHCDTANPIPAAPIFNALQELLNRQ